MVTDSGNPNLIFGKLFEIWKQSNFDLNFYFERIFDNALTRLKEGAESGPVRVLSGSEPTYKALFVPVGFSAENIALVTTLFSPLHLTLAFSESSRSFHMRHFHMVENKIRQHCPSIQIEKAIPIASEDHKHIQHRVLEWAQRMNSSYGFSMQQMAIDLTGGTKPMSIGAQNAAISLRIAAFYLSVVYDDQAQPIPGTEVLLQMPQEQSQTEPDLAFVIMPFKKELDPVLTGISDTICKGGLRCLRADQEIFYGGIMDRVRENIAKAGVVIAELSEKNPNVYYELGLAHAWNKKVIMVTQNIQDVPFDLKHLRLVTYDASDIEDLKMKLKKEIAAIERSID